MTRDEIEPREDEPGPSKRPTLRPGSCAIVALASIFLVPVGLLAPFIIMHSPWGPGAIPSEWGGVVRDSATGVPIPGVEVLLEFHYTDHADVPQLQIPPHMLRTDADGAFSERSSLYSGTIGWNKPILVARFVKEGYRDKAAEWPLGKAEARGQDLRWILSIDLLRDGSPDSARREDGARHSEAAP